MEIGDFNYFDLEPKTANFIEDFKDKYILDKQYTIYLNGPEKQHIEATCKKYNIKAPIISDAQIPKKYPNANIDILLTPGFYTAIAKINDVEYKAYIYCNNQYKSECYIINAPSSISNIKNIELSQLNYLPNNKFTPIIQDFIDSCVKNDQIKTYIQNNSNNPTLINDLSNMMKIQFEKKQIDSKYVNDLSKHNYDMNDYVRFLIYRIILVSINAVHPNIDTISLKNAINSNKIKFNIKDIKSKLQNPLYITLFNNINN